MQFFISFSFAPLAKGISPSPETWSDTQPRWPGAAGQNSSHLLSGLSGGAQHPCTRVVLSQISLYFFYVKVLSGGLSLI